MKTRTFFETFLLTLIGAIIVILVGYLVIALTVPIVRARMFGTLELSSGDKHASSESIATSTPPKKATTTPSLIDTSIKPEIPGRIIIPKINVDTKIQLVGRTYDGKRMAVPRSYTEPGWYKLGPKPGQIGNAVLAGHLDNGFGLDAVFADINKLIPGDEIKVQDALGNTFTFAVTDTKTFSVTNADTNAIFGSSTERHLNLITCDGTWIEDKKMYDKRLVVFTELIKTSPPDEASTRSSEEEE